MRYRETYRPELKLPEQVESPESFLDLLEEKQRSAIAKVLGFKPDLENYRKLESEWGSLRPLLVLASKYRGGFSEGLALFRQMAEAALEGKWKEFRYQGEGAKRLLEGLTPSQSEQWISNLEPMTLEEVRVSAVEAEGQVAEIGRIIMAGLDQGHLYSAQNPESVWAHDVQLWVRNTVEHVEGYDLELLKKARIISGLELYRRTGLTSVMKELGITQEMEPAEALRLVEAKIKEIEEAIKTKPSAKLEANLGRMHAAARWAREMMSLGQEAEVMREKLGLQGEVKLEEIKDKYSNFQTAEKILRLTVLKPEEVRANALMDENGKLKRGELAALVTGLIEELHKKHSAFIQDIENCLVALRAKGGETKLSGLRMEESDHPKTLLETGKYPLGSGSCQNYEGRAEFNKCLLAYVVDADKKIITVRKKDGSIVARTIIKLVWLEDEPAIFVEPTYTSVNKGDHDFDADFNRYLLEKAKRMGSVKVLRGSMNGPLGVRVRASRNKVQYEDGGSGGADNVGLGIKSGTYSMGAHEVVLK